MAQALVSEGVVLRPARYTVGHFGDEFFQVISCTGTDMGKLAHLVSFPLIWFSPSFSTFEKLLVYFVSIC